MILTAIILTVAGVLIKYGKMYFLIAGYNTMPAKKKAEYDIKRIAAIMAHIFFAMSLMILLGTFLSFWLEIPEIEWYALSVAIFIGIPLLLVITNSKKYKKDSKE